ncbi:MAG: YHS domain-containing (seleno)protein [Pseudomonadota bacterium]
MAPISRRSSLALLASTVTFTATTPRLRAEPIYLDGRGRALRGYDPVAYFTEEQAIEGSPENIVELGDAIWQFEFPETVETFRENPEAYMPQYGGFCAEGISRGFKRISDPTVWVMVNGKLYVHYSVEAQNRWAADIRGNIRQADKNWPELRAL